VESIAGDYFALTPAALMLGHHISLSAYCNAASASMVAATVAIGAFVFRPRPLTVTIGCDLNRRDAPFEIPTEIWKLTQEERRNDR
jgi:hypothetical protein